MVCLRHCVFWQVWTRRPEQSTANTLHTDIIFCYVDGSSKPVWNVYTSLPK